ncbi:hypothetical protein C8Q74DRAFT_984680 [Fomes fomentarius]|nr:hypothetical protein C8Q74DRAFT_984680 [Fomes fomentarius]
MRTLLRILSISTFFSSTICATAAIDDSDPRVHYSGSWTRIAKADPQNWQSTLTYSNVSSAQAMYTFTWAVQVMVMGAFPRAGTFAMRSKYMIDNEHPVFFEPAGTIRVPQFRQKFFVSNPISPQDHTLTITNLGEEFYLDFVFLNLEAANSSLPAGTQPSSNTITSSTSNMGSTHFESTVVASSTTVTASGSSSFGISSSSTTGVVDDTLGRKTPPWVPGVGAGIGAFATILSIAGGVYCWRRHRQKAHSTKCELTPFDSALAASPCEKRHLAQSTDYREPSPSWVTSQSAPPYTLGSELRPEDSAIRHRYVDTPQSPPSPPSALVLLVHRAPHCRWW